MHAWDALCRLGARQHGAVTRRQASELGVSSRAVRRMLDAAVLREPVPGVLVFAAAPATFRQRLWIATQSAGGEFVVAGRAAAWLHALDGFGQEPPIELLGARGRRPPPMPDLVLHTGRLDPADRHAVDGIPCTTLARTICDIAGLGADVARRAIDDFERRRFSLRWLAATADRLHRPGQSGTRVVRELLASRDGRASDSWFERLVEACVALPGLPPWTRQHEVRRTDGCLIGRVDLACVALRLAVEAHSRRFHFGAVAGAGDQHRDDLLAAEGWDVRYVGWHAAERTPRDVSRMIAAVARRRAADLGVALPPPAAT